MFAIFKSFLGNTFAFLRHFSRIYNYIIFNIEIFAKALT